MSYPVAAPPQARVDREIEKMTMTESKQQNSLFNLVLDEMNNFTEMGVKEGLNGK